MRRHATAAFSCLIAAIGLVLIVETAVVRGGVGFLIGALFLLAGGLRLYLSLR